MHSLFLMITLVACKGTTEVGPPPPPTMPIPVPTPPPPAPDLPANDTLLNSIPATEWPAICDAFAMAQDAILLNCQGISLDLPARDAAEDAAACVSYFQRAPTWDDCPATFADFRLMTNYTPTCDPFPPEVERIRACANPVDVPPTPPPPIPTCEVLFEIVPFDGATDVFGGDDLIWSFTAEDASAVVDVFDSTGATVPGVSFWQGQMLSFHPDAPLPPNAAFETLVTWCNGLEVAFASFTTNSFGAPTVPTDLIGHTYAIDLTDPSVQFIEPAGLGPLLQSQLPVDIRILLGVDAVVGDSIDFTVAMSSDGLTQDLCVPTQAATADFPTNPYFSTPPFEINYGGAFAFTIEEAVISGAFHADGASAALELGGLVDTRPLVDLLSPGGADDAVCLLLSQFGASCVPCPAGGDFCLPLRINNIQAADLAGLDLVERSSGDIAADATCVP